MITRVYFTMPADNDPHWIPWSPETLLAAVWPQAVQSVMVDSGLFYADLDREISQVWCMFESQNEPASWVDAVVLDLNGGTQSNSVIDSLVEMVDDQPRFTRDALSQVVRWVAGPVLPNEPYPPARRLGTKDLVLFNGEDLPLVMPLEHLDDETLSSVEGQEVRFVVETAKKAPVASQLLTVENGSIAIESTASITTEKRTLFWALRRPDNNAYLTGGRITVAYAPL